MKSIYEALNSKLAKAIVCSILGLYIIYLIVLTVLLKSPFEFPIVFQSVLYTNFGLVGFWDDPASPCQPTAFGVEQIFIISLILLFTLINLLTDKFDDHEIIRFSLLFGAFALLLSNFIVYVQNEFGFERFTHFTWFFPVMIINGALMLFTIFKMVLCFANRKMIFHRYFIEYGCFILGIYFTSFMLSFAQTIYNPVEFPWSYVFAYGFNGPLVGVVLIFVFGCVVSPAISYGIVIPTIFSIVFMIICIVRNAKKKKNKTNLE